MLETKYETITLSVVKICKRCCVEFSTTRSNILYCSSRCKRRKSDQVYLKVLVDDIEGFMKKECTECGNQFNTVNAHKYTCSEKCYKAHHYKHRQTPEARERREQWKLTTGRYSALKKRIKHKAFSYVMKEEAYLKIIKENCYYCGVKHWGIEKGVGLDRLDNNIEYLESNVVSCCGKCNRSKSDVYSSDMFRIMVAKSEDKYMKALELINNAQKTKRTLEEFVDLIIEKYSS